MNYSYERWEKDFLNEMAIKKFSFSGNHYIAFIERLLLENEGLSNAEILNKEKYQFLPRNMIADSWCKKIYPKLKQYKFDYRDDNENPDGKYEKNYADVRAWLISQFFSDFVKTIPPQSSIEIWQQLWDKAEDNSQQQLQIFKY
ncbi:hypothetical protein FJR38_26105 [Anabaena sp. UHCC 0253]|uniref:hypothetical protein n=1 Tax=Anabaena sp. UHCC 0253 TaxID=2590019 RepID=UPI001446394D|nr:hypothetical protein [Anabaena sp. UHCC 0253]MTJ55886.1 hypothetical protein [Anabaena sp. UHCC 0253]